jgi:hypothetical protein
MLLLISITFTTTVNATEITPFAGYRIGGEFEDYYTGASIDLRDAESYGVALDFDLSPGKQLELFYSRQETTARVSPAFIVPSDWDLAVEYYHIGGLLNFKNFRQFRPFVAGGMGVTRIDPENFSAESRFSLSLAGGGKLYLNDNIGLRLEARGYWTFLNSSGAVFCGNGGCHVAASGSAWLQFETNLGVFVNF